MTGELDRTSILQHATNIFRFFAYPLWGLHFFLVFAITRLIQTRKETDRSFLAYCVLLAAPYTILLLRYIPHAGYYPMLLPVITAIPMLQAQKASRLTLHKAFAVAALAVIFLLQWFCASPVETVDGKTLIANTYFLQYTRAGIKQGMFETLSTLSEKTGVWADRVPGKNSLFLETETNR